MFDVNGAMTRPEPSDNGRLSGTSAMHDSGQTGGLHSWSPRDSGTLSGTSPPASRSSMARRPTIKIVPATSMAVSAVAMTRRKRKPPIPELDRDPRRRRHPSEAADAFLSLPRTASPNTRRAYVGVIDGLAAELGPLWPLAAVPGDESAATLHRRPQPPGSSPVIMRLIDRFSDTRPDGPRSWFPAGGDCLKNVLRSRRVQQLRHSRFPYSQEGDGDPGRHRRCR